MCVTVMRVEHASGLLFRERNARAVVNRGVDDKIVIACEYCFSFLFFMRGRGKEALAGIIYYMRTETIDIKLNSLTKTALIEIRDDLRAVRFKNQEKKKK